MDARTQASYESDAAGFAQRYEGAGGGIRDWFDVAFPKGCRVLDIGSGSGRDLAHLLRCGWDPVGVEPVLGLREQSLRYHAELDGRVYADGLPGLSSFPDASFDGVLCSAVLMHVPEQELFDSVFSIRRVLCSGGRLLVSLPANSDGSPVSGRDDSGRLFSGLTPGKLEFLLTRCGFSKIGAGQAADSLGRPDRSWFNMLFVLDSAGNRSIDRIEAVLNRDRKTATYKLALVRALAEIAMTQYNCARWLPDDRVAVPVGLISEKWLGYYWCLYEHGTFIPQMNGERDPGCRNKLRFRTSLTELATGWGAGGLPEFLAALRVDELPPIPLAQAKRVLRDIGTAIEKGPVEYARGGDGDALFAFDRATRCVLMSTDLWQELALMGPWIREATILRWGELSSNLSHGTVPAGDVINLLIRDVSPARNVADSRRLYSGTGGLRCVWTGEPLGRRKWDVDHAIPFSLWRNNDLWNLFPATNCANNSKRDSLPSRRLVTARRYQIQETWELVAENLPTRFFAEARIFGAALSGTSPGWPDLLFQAFAEALEFTALQRGAPRWEP